MMGYAYASKEGMQGLILSSPICLDSTDLTAKLSFNKVLEVMKTLEDFRFVMQQV